MDDIYKNKRGVIRTLLIECVFDQKNEEPKMANKTRISAEIKHAMIDIETEIDAEINERIRNVKDVYADDIRGFKETKNTEIKSIKADKRTMMKEAVNRLVSEEEA